MALHAEELAFAEADLAGEGGPPGRGRNGGLGGLARVASLGFGLFVVGADGLSEPLVLLFVVAFVRSLGLDLGWRLTFGSFGLWRSVGLVRGGLLRVDRWR